MKNFSDAPTSIENWTSDPGLQTVIQNVLLPIGYTYTQLPNQKPPTEIWPKLKWHDISTEYPGIFFRVVGGNANAFGYVQEDNAPTLTDAWAGWHGRWGLDFVKNGTMVTPKGDWSQWIYTGVGTERLGYGKFQLLKFKRASGEVRPRNMAVRIWKRL